MPSASTQEPPEDHSLSLEAVMPLLEALHDPSAEVRTEVLRVLVRLPLAPRAWVRLARHVLSLLADPGAGPPIDRGELILAAARVPTTSVRGYLHRVLEEGPEDQRRQVARALAVVRDQAALTQLVCDLSERSDEIREAAAERLCYLDVAAERGRLREICRTDRNANVRFWLAVALARAGETACIETVFVDLGNGTLDVPLLDSLASGDPEVRRRRLGGWGPFPDSLAHALDRIASAEGAPSFLASLAEDLLRSAGPARPGEPEEAPPVRGPSDAALQAEAARLAERYVLSSPLKDTAGGAARLWEKLEVLRHLSPEPASSLLTVLFRSLVRDVSPDSRLDVGNWLVTWLSTRVGATLVPDVGALVASFLDLRDGVSYVRPQLAWILSRGGMRPLLSVVGSTLATGDGAERLSVLGLLGDAVRYAPSAWGPVFGGGAEAVDVVPTVGELIDDEFREAAVGPATRGRREEPSAPEMEPLFAHAAPEPEPTPRHIVNPGFATRAEPRSPVRMDTPLSCGQDYYFWLEIGEKVRGSIARRVVELPTHLLPEEAALRVVLFSFPGGVSVSEDARVGALRVRKDGSVCVEQQPIVPAGLADDPELLSRRLFFPVRTPDQPGPSRLRCNIYYRQALVQSWLIEVLVGEAAPEGVWSALSADADFTIAHSLRPESLTGIKPHCLSVMLNRNPDATHSFRFYGKKGEGPDFAADVTLSEGHLGSFVDELREGLRLAAWGAAREWRAGDTYRYEAVHGTGEQARDRLMHDLLSMARRGYRFYRGLSRTLTRSRRSRPGLSELMLESGRVQFALLDSPSHFVPIALVYDYPLDSNAPPERYRLCPGFEEALKGTSPLEECSCFEGKCPSVEERTTICPSGFWGFRHDLGMPLSLGDAPDLPPEILYERNPQLFVCVSTDQDLRQRAQHEAVLKSLRPTPRWRYADSRDAALSLLDQPGPHIVYLYCHGGTAGRTPFLQVGPKDERGITSDNLARDDENKPWIKTRPLVFINGCHTTALSPKAVMDFVSVFVQDAGASGVMGTEITVVETLARAFAEGFLQRLLEGEELGRAVRATRLALLKRGDPLGLAYVPFAMASLRLRDKCH